MQAKILFIVLLYASSSHAEPWATWQLIPSLCRLVSVCLCIFTVYDCIAYCYSCRARHYTRAIYHVDCNSTASSDYDSSAPSVELTRHILSSTPSLISRHHSLGQEDAICDSKSRQKGLTRSGWRYLDGTSGPIQIGEPDLDFFPLTTAHCNLRQQSHLATLQLKRSTSYWRLPGAGTSTCSIR